MVFLAAIIEAVAVLGILVPGTPILMAVAGAAAMAGQPMLPFLALSIVGAVIGDFLSFWVGRRFSFRLRCFWPFSRRPTLMDNAMRFFDRYGSTASPYADSSRCCGPRFRWSPAWRVCSSDGSSSPMCPRPSSGRRSHIYPAQLAGISLGSPAGRRLAVRRPVGRHAVGRMRRGVGSCTGVANRTQCC